MTDLERFIELYASVGIPLQPEAAMYPRFVPKDEADQMLYLTADETPKVIGYSQFYTWLRFDKEGKFIEQGIYE
jgi:hypothetical protein